MATFNTEELKRLVAYATKGAGFNKILELTNDIGIEATGEELTLRTFDGTNYVTVKISCMSEVFDITVDADLFSKLMSKITSDTVELTVVNNTLVVNGNGKYTLAIIPDENGEQLSFPDKLPKNLTEIGKLSVEDLVIMTSAIQASLDNIPGSVYSSYYLGDIIASTDRAMMSTYNKKIFDTPYSLNRAFVDLIKDTGSDVVFSTGDNMIVAQSTRGDITISVFSAIPTNVSEFNIDGINKFIALKLPCFCRVNKAEFIEILDRIALFVSKFDDGIIQLQFTNTDIVISSITTSGVEHIEYAECKDVQDMTIKININRLRNQLKSYNSDMVDLYFGNDMCIKMTDGEITQLIALIR